MNLSTKLKDFKDRLKDRHMLSIVVTSLTLLLLMGVYIYKLQATNKQYLENEYNHAFFELAEYINNIDTILVKSQISKDPIHGTENMTEVWRQANLAKTYLDELPIEENVIQNTSKFLSQTSDFSYSLARQTLRGNPISDEQLNQIKSLSTYSSTLQENLSNLASQLSEGTFKWNQVKNEGTQVFSKLSSTNDTNSFSEIGKQFQEYPGLIYDGPFSNHITDIQPRGITGNEITQEEATTIAQNFFGKDRITEIISVTDTAQANIPAFSVEIKTTSDGIADLDISKVGGHVLWLIYNRNVDEKNLDIEAAQGKALEFLESRGINNMQSTYYTEESNIATINFAYTENNVTMYTDLIKVSVSLDNGEILGYEATGYYFSHTDRNLENPKISMEEAKSLINKNLNVHSSGLALIPTDTKEEILCYEFKGKIEEREFIVYINAKTGAEENILLVLHTPNGVLTI